jgi:hypothetical protein
MKANLGFAFMLAAAAGVGVLVTETGEAMYRVRAAAENSQPQRIGDRCWNGKYYEACKPAEAPPAPEPSLEVIFTARVDERPAAYLVRYRTGSGREACWIMNAAGGPMSEVFCR